MKMNITKSLFIPALIVLSVLTVGAQTKSKYSYQKQKQLIPIELGKVYLGMPFDQFAKQIDLSKAEVSNRFGWLEGEMPLAKGNVESITFKVHGLEESDYATLIKKVTRGKKTERNEDYEVEVQMLDMSKIPAKGVVYEIGLTYKKGFDLKSHAKKIYGAPKDVRKATDDHHIYDIQWTRKTTDGLTWLIRYYESSNSIMLAGIIDKTEWDPTAE